VNVQELSHSRRRPHSYVFFLVHGFMLVEQISVFLKSDLGNGRIKSHLQGHEFAGDHTAREITLASGSGSYIDIGRASKDTKKNLVADIDSALFGCRQRSLRLRQRSLRLRQRPLRLSTTPSSTVDIDLFDCRQCPLRLSRKHALLSTATEDGR